MLESRLDQPWPSAYALSADSNSMQGVQPLLRRYWTWRAISWSDRGGRKEKVSKNLMLGEGVGEGRLAGCFAISIQHYPDRQFANGKKAPMWPSLRTRHEAGTSMP